MNISRGCRDATGSGYRLPPQRARRCGLHVYGANFLLNIDTKPFQVGLMQQFNAVLA